MDNTLWGSLLGILAALASHWISSRNPTPSTVGTNGSVTDGETCVTGDDSPLEPVAPLASRVLEFMRGVTRPALTAGFFLVWLGVKAVLLFFAVQQEPAVSLPSVFWTEDDAVLFATVITFWFGSRIFRMRR
jgi:hypothetical protein